MSGWGYLPTLPYGQYFLSPVLSSASPWDNMFNGEEAPHFISHYSLTCLSIVLVYKALSPQQSHVVNYGVL